MDSAIEICFISGIEAGGPRSGASRAAVPEASLPGQQMGSSHGSSQSGTLSGTNTMCPQVGHVPCLLSPVGIVCRGTESKRLGMRD